MWQSKSLSGAVEIENQNENEYSPPQKKSREFSETNVLEEALNSCKHHEIGIEEASLIYGVPKSTLRAKLNEINVSAVDENYRVFVLSLFPADAESDLVNFLQDCATSQITFTTTEVRRLGYELVCEKYKVPSLPKEKNCLLGQRWYKKFIEKYPHLDHRNQILVTDEDKSMNFYNSFETLSKKFDIGPSQIYAVDGINLKFRASFSGNLKDFQKRRILHTNAKAICCFNPVGDSVSPCFMRVQNSNNLNFNIPELDECSLDFLNTSYQSNVHLDKMCDKLKQMSPKRLKNFPKSEDLINFEKQIKMHLNKKLQPMSEENEEELREKLYDHFVKLKNRIMNKCEKSNEITPEAFYNWFVGFLCHVKPNPQKAVLLLLSDQSYVKSFKVLELGKKNNVIFLILPPHSAHKIYPLDGFSMSLNRNLSTCASRWLAQNPDFKVQQIPLHILFLEAFNETLNPLITKNGFLYSGIWPINRNIFQTSELGGESILVLNKQKLTLNDDCTLSTVGLKGNGLSSLGITNEADLSKLCRVCLKEKMYMKPLLGTVPLQGPNYHAKKLIEIAKVSVSFGDGLPPVICQYCLVELMEAIKIKELTVESHKKQAKLREALDRFYFEEDESDSQDLLFLLDASSGTSQTNDTKIMSKLMSKNFDINSICRICMGEKPLMTSIFFGPQGGAIMFCDTSTRITEVAQCEAHIQDGLSSYICPFCRASIYKASDFIRRALSSDKILKEIILNFRTKN